MRFFVGMRAHQDPSRCSTCYSSRSRHCLIYYTQHMVNQTQNPWLRGWEDVVDVRNVGLLWQLLSTWYVNFEGWAVMAGIALPRADFLMWGAHIIILFHESQRLRNCWIFPSNELISCGRLESTIGTRWNYSPCTNIEACCPIGHSRSRHLSVHWTPRAEDGKDETDGLCVCVFVGRGGVIQHKIYVDGGLHILCTYE